MLQIPAAMSTASRRGRVRPRPGASRAAATATASVLLTLAAVVPACKLDQNGVSPPLDRVAFPASALVDPDGHWLYVANSNSDLRYNNGTLVAVDLEAAMDDRFGAGAGKWSVCAGADRVRVDSDPDPCCWDYLDHQILNCDDRLYVPPSSTVEIGSFSAGMAYQAPLATCPPNADSTAAAAKSGQRHDCVCPTSPSPGRLYVGVRGNSSLTWVAVGRVNDGKLRPIAGKPNLDRSRPVFSCPDPLSDDPHVCTVTETTAGFSTASGATAETPVHVPDEPYALALDEQQDLLYVGNLRGDTAHPQTGGISLFDVARDRPGAAPVFLQATPAFFNPDANGQFGVTSLTLRNSKVYVTSRYGTNAVDVIPSIPNQCGAAMNISLSTGGDVFTTPLAGAELRGIQFLPEGNRAFVLQRTPPALVGFDTSTNPLAFGNFPSDVLETCASPTFLQAYDSGEGTRLYVTCFDAGQIYVFDPYVPRLIEVINAGAGPAGLAFPRQLGEHPVAYVVGFSANDIGVIDLMPGSPTQYHVVQRIGFPSVVPR